MAVNRLLYWAPRVLGILFVLFTSLFALDVFDMSLSPSEVIVALFMHLIPSMVLAILLMVAWRYELVGGIIFLLLGLAFPIIILLSMSDGEAAPGAINPIAAPLCLIGVLFIANAIMKKYRG